MTTVAGAPSAAFQGCYRNTSVLLTGATGFKGAWLAHWLRMLGADVSDISLASPTGPSVLELAGSRQEIRHHAADLREPAAAADIVADVKSRVVFHLAAQALVRQSHQCPGQTFATNVLGTVHVLDAVRRAGHPCAVVVVTSDKCYADAQGAGPHAEGDRLGGRDPYSASKACAELVVSSFRHSFFPVDRLADHGVAVASARAGNVMGPGDWAEDRLVPDSQRALAADLPVSVRNPSSVRPWQHVLEPLSGYLWLGAKLLRDEAPSFCESWNFGPEPDTVYSVREVVEEFIACHGEGTWTHTGDAADAPEAVTLRLDITKARGKLAWWPVWGFRETVRRTCDGYHRLTVPGIDAPAVRDVLSAEIGAYEADARRLALPWSVPEGVAS